MRLIEKIQNLLKFSWFIGLSKIIEYMVRQRMLPQNDSTNYFSKHPAYQGFKEAKNNIYHNKETNWICTLIPRNYLNRYFSGNFPNFLIIF